MIRNLRIPTLIGVLAAAFCLATLTPLATNEALAQGSRSPGWFHSNQYHGYGYGNYGYGPGNYGYTGYGNGPYGYGSNNVYVYPTPGGYGYSNGTPYNAYYPDARFDGRTYRRTYVPNNGGYYYPYGYR